MTFDDEYRDEATADSVVVGGYQPIDFATDVRALTPFACNLNGSIDLTREESGSSTFESQTYLGR